MVPKPLGRDGARRGGGGGRPALQLNLVPYVIGTFFLNKIKQLCFGRPHIYEYIYIYIYMPPYSDMLRVWCVCADRHSIVHIIFGR